MSYLNVSPMISALRTSPEQFAVNRGTLQHIPSHHSFLFDSQGRMTIAASCGCSTLAVEREQEIELVKAFRQWNEEYWRPRQINEEFTSHFAPPPLAIRVLLRLTDRFRLALLRMGQKKHHHEEAMIPAE
ncbi:MAG: hypothetical protein BGN87_17030 [Rhizobiales bacterium 65-79]|mgnify:CR=1 FL=1|nr:MAG: hypothetical protein BGN87_17030 [Rhizobiales bacterium 65-79]